uniref:Uncharacterized protein n=1 Tax=Lepeophtheirus salmonis TaxID=72036 RepID=A0A0K2VL22_LEPSM
MFSLNSDNTSLNKEPISESIFPLSTISSLLPTF